MNENEFDLDFDFEKEYGIDPPKEEPAPPAAEPEDEFDLNDILGTDFAEGGDLFNSEFEPEFDYGPETEEYLPVDDSPVMEPVAEEPPVMEEEIPETSMPELEEEPQEKPARRPRPERSGAEGEQRPRKPMSPMRKFKNETLPLLIAGAAAILIVIFVIGSLSRVIGNLGSGNDTEMSGETTKTQEQLEQEAADRLLYEAAELAQSYDFDSAIAKLESFTGSTEKYPEVSTQLSAYRQTKATLIAHNDPSAIPNFSFHVLIADPSRAFTNESYGKAYNMNFVTIDEFQKILEQLYANNYVLVDMDDFISETVNGDTVTYAAKSLYLPDGKKPFMLTETYGYLNFMVDSDNDGEADKNGGGFASRLVLQNGEVKAEMVNSAGETVVGDYALVPVLNNFIEQHPDFSYQGARALLATTGYNGIFGYRTQKSVIDSKGQEYYDQQVAAAKQVVQALQAEGYEIGCYTYNNVDYGDLAASAIQEDIDTWVNEMLPITGAVDKLVYARNSDISAAGAYSGSKYNVLAGAGFRYFISNGNSPSAKVNNEYVRQNRIMVTGTLMAHAATIYNNYFDAKTVLNSLRGNVPQ